MKNDCFIRLTATPLVKNLPFLIACAFIGSAYANPTDFFRSEDAVAYTNCVKTIRNVQCGEFYTVCWDGQADYHTDRMLASGCKSSVGMIAWACSNVLNQAPVPQVVTDLGCSAFAATNALGAPLAGRNFDYRYRMSHALVYVPRATISILRTDARSGPAPLRRTARWQRRPRQQPRRRARRG